MRWLIRTRTLLLVNSLLSIGPICMMAIPIAAPVGGSVLVLLGAVLAVTASRAGYVNAHRLAIVQIVVALLCPPLVWSLRSISLMLAVTLPLAVLLVIALFIASLCIWRDPPARDLRLHCDRCGYWLKGQTVNRCSECGQRFDPARLDV